MNCTRCEGFGFLNVEQLPGDLHGHDFEKVLIWIADESNAPHDVQVCDCCGDGEEWYGTPGEHYGIDDPSGIRGPYRDNGGVARCH